MAECEISNEWNVTGSGENDISFSISIGKDNPDDICRKLFWAFAGRGRAIIEMSAKRANLEEIFIELTQGSEEAKVENTQTDDAEPAEPALQGSVPESEAEENQEIEKEEEE